MINVEDRKKLFVNEFNEIQDKNLRAFAEDLITNADEYFFTIAASTTGKYHPQFDLGTGGLVRHTRCVAFFAECEAISRCFTDYEKDILIVAALAHDIKKLGDGTGVYTVPDHPKWAAEYVLERQKATNLITTEDAKLISDVVYSHMGKWGVKDGMPAPKTELEKALQAADYIASRKEILNFDFKPTESVVITEEPKSPGDFVIGFGRNNGKTIKEVYEADKAKGDTYLHWMMRQTDFNNQETRLMGMRYLHEIGQLPQQYLTEINVPEKKEEIVSESQVNIQNTSGDSDDLPF